jgi:hypothetical protein
MVSDWMDGTMLLGGCAFFAKKKCLNSAQKKPRKIGLDVPDSCRGMKKKEKRGWKKNKIQICVAALMEKDKGKQTEREGSTAADVEAEDQEEPPVADGEGTRRRKRRKGSDEDDDGQALGPRKCWRATTGEEKKTKYSAREDEALLASVQAFCSVCHNPQAPHQILFFLFYLWHFVLYLFIIDILLCRCCGPCPLAGGRVGLNGGGGVPVHRKQRVEEPPWLLDRNR